MKHKSCPTCGDTLVDDFKCSSCGWVSKNYQEHFILQCFACHKDIGDKYYRVFVSKNSTRYKCVDCLLYADLDWRDKLNADLLEEHPEFKFKPQTKQDSIDFQKICMDYMRKIAKAGLTRPLPYDKKSKAKKIEYNEQELLDQAPRIEG